ncbi:MAG: fibrinogen-like YCDxxxxGGGW domain-containing protein [Myxococcota bacterium]
MAARPRFLNRALATRQALLLSFASIACSLLAPPDDRFISPARGGAGGRDLEAVNGAGGRRLGSGGKFNSAAGGTAGAAGEAGSAGNAGSGGIADSGGSGGSISNAAGNGGAKFSDAGSGGSDSSEAGSGGAPPACTPTSCGANAVCEATATAVHCTCASGWIPEGLDCRLPISCDELHVKSPSLPSGVYSIRPTAANHASATYCEMLESGGGWTLILNESWAFMPKTPGTDDATCYDKNCTSSVYSVLPLGRDVMLDVANEDIIRERYLARIRILGVHSASRGKTLREMFTSGPYFMERGDNSNVTITTKGGAACEEVLPPDFASIFCSTCPRTDQPCGKAILTFGDADSACHESVMFAIGASDSESQSWNNCAGWPQDPFLLQLDDTVRQYYPTNVRIWFR